VAEAGDRWIFHALEDGVLRARRSGDEHICKIEVTSDSITITAHFYFYPKHIVLFDGELKSGISLFQKIRESKTKGAVAKALLARQLKEREAFNLAAGGIIGCVHRLQSVVNSGSAADD